MPNCADCSFVSAEKCRECLKDAKVEEEPPTPVDILRQKKADLEAHIFYDIQRFEKETGLVVNKITSKSYQGVNGPDIDEVFIHINI